MTTEQKETAVNKIAKLMRHEGSARHIGSLAEAELFAAKAQELMIQHKLQMSDIEAADLNRDEPIEDEYINVADMVGQPQLASSRKQSWVGVMLVGLSKANFCYIIGNSGRSWAYHIIGRKSDRDALKAMARYLYDACIEVANIESANYREAPSFPTYTPRPISGRQSRSGVMKKFRNAFKIGFAGAVAHRMQNERQALLNDVNEQGLIKLDGIRAQIDEFVKTRYVLSKGRHARPNHTAGYYAGSKYGSSIGINSSKRLVA